jgi:hypothetical protein
MSQRISSHRLAWYLEHEEERAKAEEQLLLAEVD